MADPTTKARAHLLAAGAAETDATPFPYCPISTFPPGTRVRSVAGRHLLIVGTDGVGRVRTKFVNASSSSREHLYLPDALVRAEAEVAVPAETRSEPLPVTMWDRRVLHALATFADFVAADAVTNALGLAQDQAPWVAVALDHLYQNGDATRQVQHGNWCYHQVEQRDASDADAADTLCIVQHELTSVQLRQLLTGEAVEIHAQNADTLVLRAAVHLP